MFIENQPSSWGNNRKLYLCCNLQCTVNRHREGNGFNERAGFVEACDSGGLDTYDMTALKKHVARVVLTRMV